MAFYMRRLAYPAERVIPVVRQAHALAPRFAPYRVLLATLLASLGDHEEAADVIRGIPPDAVHCRCCLRRMAAIFRLAGEHASAAAAGKHP
jgi:hypothetical protein